MTKLKQTLLECIDCGSRKVAAGARINLPHRTSRKMCCLSCGLIWRQIFVRGTSLDEEIEI